MEASANPVAGTPSPSVERTSYSKYHKKYYETHKETISEKRREAKPWLTYYAQHAEAERARKRQAYARKKAQMLAASDTNVAE